MSHTPSLLSIELVRVGATPATKEAAIREAAQMLVAAGRIDVGYVESMMRRETVANTFLGHGVAIPHGMIEDRSMIRDNGLAVLQIPGGVTWNEGQTVRLVVAIAAQSDAHIALLRRLTRLIQDEAALERLATTTDANAILAALSDDAPVAPPSGEAAIDFAERFDWVVDYPNGLHARPAAHWVDTARRSSARLRIRAGERVADPKNLISLLQLGLVAGESVVVSAEGGDAADALARMKAAITGLTIQEKADAAKAAIKAAAPRGWTPPSALPSIPGIGASPGLAVGRVHVLRTVARAVPDVPVPLVEGGAALDAAIVETKQQLQVLADDTGRRLGAAEAKIFEAQAEFLADTDLVTLACQLMVEGHGPAWAWNEAVERSARSLSAMGNPLLAARAVDLRDAGHRVLLRLAPELAEAGPNLPEGQCILVAEDLTPSDTAGLDTSRVIGLATVLGGPTSHTAILARTLGLPAMVAGGAALRDLEEGAEVVLDGEAGRLWLAPDDAAKASVYARRSEDLAHRAREAEERASPAVTLDGRRIEIGANANTPDQVALALDLGAEGVGLMRTEFLFLERSASPSEDEQAAIYTEMAAALDGRPLIVRLLDIGGDKQVAHLKLPHEENPFLGVRGARLLLRRPDLLEPQLRAIYRAAKAGGRLSIMAPMITSLSEVLALRAVCDRIRAEIGAPEVPIGIMVEVPAAAAMADRFAPHVDFFSIGTNDLTQYTLAIDRQHPDLAIEADALHPAVLRLVAETVRGAATCGRWVGVCGGIAGDPFGASILAGLGVAELSMTPRDVPAVKARLRSAGFSDLEALAKRALDCDGADQVRALEGGRS
ncbi:phosphoenolpyruvate--protein phosphotransferase [Pinisolibacter aquiterrae]|uniref:phosphoenolpyruvate--protein phosphotransferase n=1 Tax=Pinisolibacter aquiterrae TaxID=2815579 RepID=UPI001C3D6BF9|nr:phosphoenolpyruvate--protein phosphotransferase [Pinisolibacter aquiterrae]MBV5266576.1 phosphoenolpyruvate--protein phosphotransferase [Pinisolibacter aquiterrae]MCC8234651.1 phosphoenolpyruvate--protein phosphotransferase [Pinisolibacter aquiterrae]